MRSRSLITCACHFSKSRLFLARSSSRFGSTERGRADCGATVSSDRKPASSPDVVLGGPNLASSWRAMSRPRSFKLKPVLAAPLSQFRYLGWHCSNERFVLNASGYLGHPTIPNLSGKSRQLRTETASIVLRSCHWCNQRRL